MVVRTPGGGRTEHYRTHLWTLMLRLHQIVVLQNCIRRKTEMQSSGDQVRPGMEQPNSEPRVPWGTGVEKTATFSPAATSVHPGLAHLSSYIEDDIGHPSRAFELRDIFIYARNHLSRTNMAELKFMTSYRLNL